MNRNPHTAARLASGVVGLFLGLMLLNGCGQPPPVSESGQRPNILIILTDDQRYDTMDFMPQTKSLIFDKGITFTHAYVTTPLCCPSRASILTGMYAHTTGVLANTDPLNQSTMVNQLHAAGYYTGMVGKYLNSWDGSPRPEFDFWISADNVITYKNPKVNVNGVWQTVHGYETSILGGYALQFVEQAAKQGKPWFLLYAVHAPHRPAVPERQYKDLYSDLPPFRPPSFNEADISDKPFANDVPLLSPKAIALNDKMRLNHLRTLKTVDDTVGALMQSLDQHQMHDNTAIFYLSDNGILMGEHRISFLKVLPYEASIRVPFGFYYSRLGVTPRAIDGMVANIDIAPTIYDLTGVAPLPGVEGKSLLPLIRGQGSWRDYLMIETWGSPDTSPGETAAQAHADREFLRPYLAVLDGRYKLVETLNYPSELYDLQNDPDEMQNQFKNPAFADIIKRLDAQLNTIRGPYTAQMDRLNALLTPGASTGTPAP